MTSMNDKSNETLLEYKKRILRVLVHIQRNLDGELSLDELARTAHFSPFHFPPDFPVLDGGIGEGTRSAAAIGTGSIAIETR